MSITPAFRSLRTEDCCEDSLSYIVSWRLAWVKANLFQKAKKEQPGLHPNDLAKTNTKANQSKAKRKTKF